MAKLLTDRTKEEMLKIEDEVNIEISNITYKGGMFDGCVATIKLINDTPVYDLLLIHNSYNNVSFEAVDYKSLMLKFRGFIQALK
jgi:hypothetical protein